LYEKTQQQVIAEERSRLARELHDAVTQTLFSASLIAEALPTTWKNNQEEGNQLLQELRQLSRGALAEMRTLLLELRPVALVDTRIEDLLRQLAEAALGREGIPVQVNIEGKCVLPSEVHVVFFRIAQEAINNIVKHARASHVNINLRSHSGSQEASCEWIELSVVDDGRGFDINKVTSEHLGLVIMQERSQSIGATLNIFSSQGEGTKIVVSWKRTSN